MDLFNTLASSFTIAQTPVNNGWHGRGWQVVAAFFLCSFLAQAIKIVNKLIRTGHFDWRIMSKTGGMPSSHSCSTMGMAATVGFIEGFNTAIFGVALCLAFVVMYDAAGVRRSVGLQAKVLNQMMEELLSANHQISSQRIKEFLGHTPLEVLVGAAMGWVIAYGFNLCALQLSLQ